MLHLMMQYEVSHYGEIYLILCLGMCCLWHNDEGFPCCICELWRCIMNHFMFQLWTRTCNDEGFSMLHLMMQYEVSHYVHAAFVSYEDVLWTTLCFNREQEHVTMKAFPCCICELWRCIKNHFMFQPWTRICNDEGFSMLHLMMQFIRSIVTF